MAEWYRRSGEVITLTLHVQPGAKCSGIAGLHGEALKLRLASARQLLQSTRAPVSDIALQCGFVNRSHFARSFHAAYGKTPSQLRKTGS